MQIRTSSLPKGIILVLSAEEFEAIKAAVEITYSDLTSVPEEYHEVGKGIWKALQP